MRNPADDPIGFVLDALWATTTEHGPLTPTQRLRSLVEQREYSEAMLLAIAMELDAAKRDDSIRHGLAIQAIHDKGALKPFLVDELGQRTLFAFLLEHMRDHRQLRVLQMPPPRPIPPAPPAPPKPPIETSK